MSAARKMLRIEDVRKLLGVHRTTVYRWMRAGQFPQPVNLGDNVMAFYEDEIAAWQKQREEQSTAPPRTTLVKPLRPRAGFRQPRAS